MRVRTLATISIGLLSAACQAPYSQNSATAPAYGSASQSSSAACADYGFRPGTTNFNQCVANEQRARANGRVNRDYTPTQLTVDARNACNSYGLAPGTATWDRCVSREVETDHPGLVAAEGRDQEDGDGEDVEADEGVAEAARAGVVAEVEALEFLAEGGWGHRKGLSEGAAPIDAPGHCCAMS